ILIVEGLNVLQPALPGKDGRQKEVLDAFLAASRGGDFEALLALLHPDVVLRADSGELVRGAAVSKLVQGAKAVAEQALMFARFARSAELVLVNGSVGVVNAPGGRVQSVMGVTIVDGRITGMYILADPERLERLERVEASPAHR
ncbi:nuclear transport factor 2 family protein, partial [Streptomyces sp. NPDC006129]|uniref:nuclear transport factor 2 family protein n=1 Tax=Streptomyces sp. NPDC006129 TaxID=3155348 RepID=UPI0033A24BA1